MGYYAYHAIVVADSSGLVAQAHMRIMKLDNMSDWLHELVSQMSPPQTNDISSFCIFPDGSKEGWTHSDEGDEFREEVKKILRELRVDFVEIRFGGDTDCATIEDDNSRHREEEE